MRVLVAGGAGFIGSHVCERLLSEGHAVIAVDNFVTGDRGNVAGIVDNDRFELLEGTVEGYQDERHVDLILHLASPASPVDFDRIPLEIIRANVLGTWRLMDVARAKRARLLFASTSEVYGDPSVHPQPEEYFGNVDPRGPRACYDEGKRLGETLVSTYFRQYGVAGRIVRIFNTYGPRMRPDDGRVVPEFISAALRGDPLVLHGTGDQTRSFCYVDDLVTGLLRIAMDESNAGEVFNLGNTEEISIRRLADAILAVTGSGSSVELGATRPQDPARRRPDIQRVQARYGWGATTSLEEGLARTISWFAAGRPGHALPG